MDRADANYRTAARFLGGVWAGRHVVGKGLGLLLAVRRAGIPVRRGVRGLRALGRRRVEGVAWQGGEIAADHLFLHEGVIPNTQISLALQLAHHWNEAQLCWCPVVDEWGRTSLPNIAIAGDGCGIAGAEAATLSGRLAALDAAAALGYIDTAECDRRARPIRADLAREQAIRPFLDALYRPSRLRGGVGRPYTPRGQPRRAWAQPAESLHPLRHGSVPGPHLWADRLGRDRRSPRRAGCGSWHLSPARAV